MYIIFYLKIHFYLSNGYNLSGKEDLFAVYESCQFSRQTDLNKTSE